MSPSLAKPILLVLVLVSAVALYQASAEYGRQGLAHTQRASLQVELAALNAKLKPLDQAALAGLSPAETMQGLLSRVGPIVTEAAARHAVQFDPASQRVLNSPAKAEPMQGMEGAEQVVLRLAGAYDTYPRLLRLLEEAGKLGAVTRLQVVGGRFEFDLKLAGITSTDAPVR